MSYRKQSGSCTNILFWKWLDQWRQEARDKGLNSQHTYAKAAASLKKYPLPLSSGKEAKIIENIGDGIAKRLDDALNEFLENGGDLEELYDNSAQKPKISRTNKGKKRLASTDFPDSDLGTVSKSPGTQSNKAKRSCKGKEYVPGYRTGPYALLITMLRNSKTADTKGYMTKSELQSDAQQLCDTSFLKPDPGSHYTAWSSMTTLIKKGFIEKEGNPPRYSLTTSGSALATKLEQVRQDGETSQLISSILDGPSTITLRETVQRPNQTDSKVSTTVQPKYSLQPEAHVPVGLNFSTSSGKAQVHPDQGLFGRLRYWYVGEDSDSLTRKDKASVNVFDSFGIGFLVKCKEADLKKSNILYERDISRNRDGDFIYVYISDKDSSEITIPPETKEPAPGDMNLKDQGMTSLAPQKSVPKAPSVFKQRPQATKSCDSIDSKIENQSSSKTMNQEERSVSAEFTLYPGDYEVVLCVDINELGGHGKKEQLVNQLRRNGVNMDVRKLQLGDFLWIAREKMGASHGKRREIVLDYIIERKRVDDLAGSIVDGRFKEQKFRLKASGLHQVIYLVEKYGSMQHLPLPEATIRQAIINTQIIDGLVVKWCDDINGSVNFLTFMTKELSLLYKNKVLHSVAVEDFKKKREGLSYKGSLKRKEHFLLNFDRFSDQTAKNKVLTVSQMFAKHLLQIRGVQVEKAAAIIEAFPTPTHLYQGYAKLDSESQRENMLADVKFGKYNKKLGAAISKQVHAVYYTNVTKGSLT